MISKLVERNYIFSETEYKEGTKDIVTALKNKKMQGLGIGEFTCEWCGVNTHVLHKHHYPIPKCEGGTETVYICPNCHHEFHCMQRKHKIIINGSKKYLAELKRLKEKNNQIRVSENAYSAKRKEICLEKHKQDEM